MTLLDDSFKSIANAVMWGRSLYRNLQRFLFFQLVVNVACLLYTSGGDGAYPRNVILRSTMVMNGRGEFVVTAVGDATEIGKVAKLSLIHIFLPRIFVNSMRNWQQRVLP